MLAGELSLTNQLVEGTASGDLSEFLGKAYQGYTWTYAVQEVQSNKLFQVDFIVQDDSPGKPVVSKMSVLLFRPQSPAGSLDGGNFDRLMKTLPNQCRVSSAIAWRAKLFSPSAPGPRPSTRPRVHAGRNHDRPRDFQHPGGGHLLDLDAHFALQAGRE